jgi:hypothetical protein
MTTVLLPIAPGRTEPYRMSEPVAWPRRTGPFNRIAYAAPHVVADPLAESDPWTDEAIDWDGTVAFRQHLWSLGLGVAEAMDTAQRGMGLGWDSARKLIRLSVEAARDTPGAVIASGVGTDHLSPSPDVTVDAVLRAYEEQCEAVEAIGSPIILMASRALAAASRSPADYEHVYGRLLSGVRQPVILHWLGEMFDPALAGYWSGSRFEDALEVVLGVIGAHPDKVAGIKISLLDKDKEIAMRRRLPPGVRMFTGDDFAYAELIEGDEAGHSDALLGIFNPIAPAVNAALGALADGDRASFRATLDPTVALSREIFRAPTRFYKTGVVFLAWLNGHQDHFTMLGGQQSARSTLHFARVFRLADAAGILQRPDLAAARMNRLLAVSGAVA